MRPASRLSNAGSQEDLGGPNPLGDQAAGAMARATAGVEALRTVGRAPTILRSPTRARWVAAPVVLAAGGGSVRVAAARNLGMEGEPRHRRCSGARVGWVRHAEGASEHDQLQGMRWQETIGLLEPMQPRRGNTSWRAKGHRAGTHPMERTGDEAPHQHLRWKEVLWLCCRCHGSHPIPIGNTLMGFSRCALVAEP